jgi:hypothetical protein
MIWCGGDSYAPSNSPTVGTRVPSSTTAVMIEKRLAVKKQQLDDYEVVAQE